VARTNGQIFEKGKQAFEKKNYDYAIDLFSQVLEGEPDNREARQLLRETEKRKVTENGYPNEFTARAMGFVPWMKSMLYSDPESVIQACESYLKIDPKNLGMRIKLARALSELGHHEAGIWELQPLTQEHAERPELFKTLGILHEKAGNSDRSAELLQRVKELDPTDREVDSMIKNTMAESTVKKGGWDEAESTQELIRDKQKAQQLERNQKILSEPDEIKSAIKDLRREIEEGGLSEDKQVEKWKRIGELYHKMNAYDQSISAYDNARELRPQDGQLKMKIGDLRLKKWDRRVEEVGRKLEEQPGDEELQQKLNELKKTRLKKKLEEYGQRVQDHPTDMELRYNYASALMKAGSVDEAISQLQEAVNDPKIRTRAYNLLGQGFMKKDHPDMAINQFKKGLENARTSDQEVELKYNLAQSYMAGGKWEQARENLREILETNYGYQDAAELLERVKSELSE